jgi:glycosyltransferase involved in cell wall biosynthesis
VKICFVMACAYMDGGTRVIATYADRLKKRGHDVTVISAPRPQPNFRQRLQSLSRLQGWGFPRQSRQASHLDLVDVDHRVIDRCRPVTDEDIPDGDVVIATWWETAEWVRDLSPAKGAKVYFIQHHELFFDGQPGERVAATWRMPLRKITISRWLQELANTEYGDPDVALILNSVDTMQFNAPERGRQSTPTVGMLYSTMGFKGCDVSLKAFDLAARQVPGLRMVAFGAEPVAPQLQLPANSEFHLRPAQADLKNLYAKCDVWLCGSHSEGFHLPPLEAMACRCPVVSTSVGGSVDIIEPGVNGYLTSPGDSGDLAQKLMSVLKMPDAHWRQMSDAAFATANRYSWDDAAVLFERALESAVQKTNLSVSTATAHAPA